MKFYPVTNEDLVKAGKHNHAADILRDLKWFIKSPNTFCRVEDPYYNNNNDLRRAIQSVIECNDLPIHVFMKHGNTYIEKE